VNNETDETDETDGLAARVLERRRLVRGESIHTERGSHAKRLETWARWAARIGFAPAPISADAGRAALEAALAARTHAATHDCRGGSRGVKEVPPSS
jgi:hypothetical protein